MLTHDRRVLLLALAGGAPAVALSLTWVWTGAFSPVAGMGLSAVIVGTWLALALAVRAQVVRPLQTVSNLLGALREGDFSIRARGGSVHDPLGQVMFEINTLAETLRAQRLGAQEATALLRSVMAEIDVAIFAFDGSERLVLVNRYGERLLGDGRGLVGQDAASLGLREALHSPATIQDVAFPGGTGRWDTRRTTFWQGGSRHQLLVLSDLSQPLREQEREAWRRLIRVIGHELNNSLAPIKSIAGSLESLLARTPPPDDWRDDMERGLGIIATRADSLSRFTSAYARLTRLPAPHRRPVDLGTLMRRVSHLDARLPVTLTEGPAVTLSGDADQIEQLLINLLRNAVDAAMETGGAVAAAWHLADNVVEVTIEDEGPGLQSTANLFVPFFTTKPGGSGIGLALSRQIAEAHGGTLGLENRGDHRGTRATLRLPLAESATQDVQ